MNPISNNINNFNQDSNHISDNSLLIDNNVNNKYNQTFKNKRKKRMVSIISIIIIFLIIICILFIINKNDSESKGNSNNNIIYTDSSYFDFNEETGVIERYWGFENNPYNLEPIFEIYIPNEINNIKVVGIGEYAFSDKNIKTVVLPEFLETIGYRSFQSNNINKIVFPKKLKRIEAFAFRNNNIEKIELPEGFIYLGMDAFNTNKALKEAIIPSTIEYIGSTVFQYTSIENLYILNRTNLDSVDLQYDWNRVGSSAGGKKIEPTYIVSTAD